MKRSAPPKSAAASLSRALIAEESEFIAPGIHTISQLSHIALERAKGRTLRDIDGREYLDFVAGIGVASVGHAHPRYVAAMGEQLSRGTVGSFTTQHRLNFLRRLAGLAPGDLKRLQFYSSGAEAVEAAVRLAKSRTGKYELIGFWGGFHGKTGGVLGVLGDSFKHGLGPLMPGLHLSPYPDPYRCPLRAGGSHDCAAHCLEFLRELIQRSTAGAPAALIVEPIQGTAGNVIPAPGFLPGLRELSRELGCLLIADEMITGFGRTGKLFGSEHEGVVPDIMTLGKGIGGGFPVSAVLTTDEIAASKPWANASGSSSSYGGNPLAAAACDTTLSILLDEKLVENSAKVGAALLERFQAMSARCRWIGHVRGRGLLIGVELVGDRTTREPLSKTICREIFSEALSRGLLTMSYNPGVRINPPLNITMEEALRGADILEAAIRAVAKKHGA